MERLLSHVVVLYIRQIVVDECVISPRAAFLVFLFGYDVKLPPGDITREFGFLYMLILAHRLVLNIVVDLIAEVAEVYFLT